jgi:hypothetical protein
MPGNLYGVSQPGYTPAAFTVGVDTTMNSGTETNFFLGSLLTPPAGGNWSVALMCVLPLLCGATPPSSFVWAARIQTFADFDTYTVPPALLVANATVITTVTFVSPALQSNWFPNGGTVQITGLSGAQNSTAKAVGSRMVAMFFRGPDA